MTSWWWSSLRRRTGSCSTTGITTTAAGTSLPSSSPGGSLSSPSTTGTGSHSYGKKNFWQQYFPSNYFTRPKMCSPIFCPSLKSIQRCLFKPESRQSRCHFRQSNARSCVNPFSFAFSSFPIFFLCVLLFSLPSFSSPPLFEFSLFRKQNDS